MLRVFGPATDLSTSLVLGLSAMAWSGGYLLFALVYGPLLLRPSLDEEYWHTSQKPNFRIHMMFGIAGFRPGRRTTLVSAKVGKTIDAPSGFI